MTDFLSIVGKENPITGTILNSYQTLQTPSPSALCEGGVAAEHGMHLLSGLGFVKALEVHSWTSTISKPHNKGLAWFF